MGATASTLTNTSVSRFIYAACNPGWESAMKREMQKRFRGDVVPAFLRPGLVTWKCLRDFSDEELSPPPVFSRLFGRSLGMAATSADLAALLADAEPMPLRFSPRFFPENGFDAAQWAEFETRREALSGILPERVNESGDTVIDLILGDPDEAVFAGIRRLDPLHREIPPIILPEDVPSRAWLKMEQALAFLGLSDLAGMTVLELGCAPGGASLAMLDRGAKVIGIDTGDMDPAVMRFAGEETGRFVHLANSAGEVPLSELPRRIEGLVSDMNLAPPVALRYIERLQRKLRARLLILTLKINDAKMESSIPSFLDRIEKLVPRYERIATQLPANRKEITILAWDPRGRPNPLRGDPLRDSTRPS